MVLDSLTIRSVFLVPGKTVRGVLKIIRNAHNVQIEQGLLKGDAYLVQMAVFNVLWILRNVHYVAQGIEKGEMDCARAVMVLVFSALTVDLNVNFAKMVLDYKAKDVILALIIIVDYAKTIIWFANNAITHTLLVKVVNVYTAIFLIV